MTIPRIFCLFCLVWLIVAVPLAAQQDFAAPSNNSELDQAIEKHFKDKNLPGLVVLYARDGMLVYKKTMGFADIESQTKVTENHIFRLASVSKWVAGILSLELAEAGELNLNSQVKSYLPNIPDHHDYRVVDLLSCRSGVRHYNEPTSPHSPTDWANGNYKNQLSAAEKFWLDPLASPTGLPHYSTHGYTILGACMEKATGHSTCNLIANVLSGPQGVPTLSAEDRAVQKPMRVSLYQLKDSENISKGNVKATPDNISWKVLGGGLECSGIDLLKLGIRLCDGKIISQQNLAKMMTRVDSDSSYALGCNEAKENGVHVMGKDGGQLGASTYIWCVPEERMVMVVLTNRQESGGAPTLGKQLRKIILGTDAADGEKPDLIVDQFKKTAQPIYKNGHWEIDFEFRVRNQGQGAANQSFVNSVRVGGNDRWSSFMPSLAPDGSYKLVQGTLKISDPGKLMPGRTIKLTAFADAPIAAADTSMSPSGRILETAESNNASNELAIAIPGGINELKGNETTNPNSGVRPPERATGHIETQSDAIQLKRPIRRLPPNRRGGN